MKAVMYHYVREYESDYPYFRFLDVENFRRQLQYFAKEFGFVDRQEWANFTKCGKMPQKTGKVILTFDDALNCHYSYVFPELVRQNLWGIFYVPTLPYSKQKVLDVHRIHLLSGAFNGELLLKLTLDLITDEMIPDAKREEFRTVTYKGQDNYKGVTAFKRILNYYIDYKYREDTIDAIADLLGYTFKGIDFYVSMESLKEMKNEGMIIGSHTNTHPMMSKLNATQQKIELETSFSVLCNVTEPGNLTYCHPYGGFHSFNEDTVDLLNKMGVKYAFNVEARDITPNDWAHSKQYLPRYDCNLFPDGEVTI